MGRTLLTSMLCSNAHNGKTLNPSACQTCVSPCAYGKQWLTSLGLPLPEETRGSIFYDSDIPELSTSLRAMFKRRGKNAYARRG